MSHIIRCPHCGKPAVSLAFIRDAAEHKAHVKEMKALADARAVRINDLVWSGRVQNILDHFEVWQSGTSEQGYRDSHYVERPIRTLGELCVMTEAELLRTPNLGRVSLAEIKEMLKAHGLCFGMSESGP